MTKLNKHNISDLKKEKLLDVILKNNEDYLNFHYDVKLDNDIKIEEKVYGNILYGIYV